LRSMGALCISAALTGCSSQRVEPPPAYTAETLPIVVALRPHDNKVAKALAPGLATEFERIALFKKVILPYQPGDAVDCAFEFEATAMTEGATAVMFGPIPSIKIIHNVSFDLTNGLRSVDRSSIHVESEFEAPANSIDVANKQAALQLRRIAIAIAEKLK